MTYVFRSICRCFKSFYDLFKFIILLTLMINSIFIFQITRDAVEYISETIVLRRLGGLLFFIFQSVYQQRFKLHTVGQSIERNTMVNAFFKIFESLKNSALL